MYYVLNGVSAGLAWLLHELFGEPRPDPAVEAFHELGVKMWPPVPSKRKLGERQSPATGTKAPGAPAPGTQASGTRR